MAAAAVHGDSPVDAQGTSSPAANVLRFDTDAGVLVITLTEGISVSVGDQAREFVISGAIGSELRFQAESLLPKLQPVTARREILSLSKAGSVVVRIHCEPLPAARESSPPPIVDPLDLPKQEKTTTVDGVTVLGESPIEKLQNASEVPLGNGSHQFVDVPEILLGKNYTKRDGYQGNTRFQVQEAQTVFLAMYGSDWGGGGNGSGNWQPEIVSREEMIELGWKEVGRLRVKHSNTEFQEEPDWLLFSRECKADEEFVMRNHKYQAPVLIWGTAE